MRILHTTHWHLGRSFKGVPLLDQQVDLELLDLDHPGVWPGEPEGYEVQDIDWKAVQDPDPSLVCSESCH